MAVIKNQKTGMWEVRTYYKDWTGTRRQKTKRDFAKKSEAQEWNEDLKKVYHKLFDDWLLIVRNWKILLQIKRNSWQMCR